MRVELLEKELPVREPGQHVVTRQVALAGGSENTGSDMPQAEQAGGFDGDVHEIGEEPDQAGFEALSGHELGDGPADRDAAGIIGEGMKSDEPLLQVDPADVANERRAVLRDHPLQRRVGPPDSTPERSLRFRAVGENGAVAPIEGDRQQARLEMLVEDLLEISEIDGANDDADEVSIGVGDLPGEGENLLAGRRDPSRLAEIEQQRRIGRKRPVVGCVGQVDRIGHRVGIRRADDPPAGVDEIDADDLRQAVGCPDQDRLRRLRGGKSVELVRLQAVLRNAADHVAQNVLDGLEDPVHALLKGQGEIGKLPLGLREVVVGPAHEQQGRADDPGGRDGNAESDDQICRHNESRFGVFTTISARIRQQLSLFG